VANQRKLNDKEKCLSVCFSFIGLFFTLAGVAEVISIVS